MGTIDVAALRRAIAAGERTDLSAVEYRALVADEERRGNKYHAERTQIDGEWFDSKAEARRWGELQLLVRAEEITSLQRQYGYRLECNGTFICDYVADFRYWDVARERWIVEDVKGGEATKTAAYRIKKRLMLACFGITILETGR